MLIYYRENLQLYLIFLFWLLVGMYGGLAIYAVVPLTLVLMKLKNMYEEMFLGFLFILILSDSLEPSLYFAKDLKNIYIVFLTFILLFDTLSFQPFNRLYLIYGPFFIFSVFTMLFSVGDAFFLTAVQKTASYFFVFLVIPNFVTKLFREEGAEFFKRLVYFLMTTIFLGFVLKYVAHDVAYIETGRYRGVMGNPNGLGIYSFLIFIIVFLINDFYPSLFNRQEIIIFYIAILFSIYITDSRNSVLAILIFYSFQRFFGFSPFLGFILFLATIFVVEIISNNLASIVLALGLGDFFRVNTLEDGSGRYIAWEFAWKQIQQNFFIGKGFAYDEFYMRQNYKMLQKMGHQGGIHNSFLTFWFDHGLVGLLIFLRSYILLFVKAAQRTKFAFPIMFAISFTAVFESWLVGSLSAFAFLGIVIYSLLASDELVYEKDQVALAAETIN